MPHSSGSTQNYTKFLNFAYSMILFDVFIFTYFQKQLYKQLVGENISFDLRLEQEILKRFSSFNIEKIEKNISSDFV